jgi:ABC-type nitrate/sulfonate/bicarbonate transport system substrate-binding protein
LASSPDPFTAGAIREIIMTRTIRLQSDSNAHDRPWRVAVEQGFFAAEGLDVEYFEDNPKGAAGRVEDFSKRWKESQLQNGALEVYPVCEWGAIERVQALGGGKIIGLDTTVRTGALMVSKESKIQSLSELRKVPIAVTWHAGTFYAAIEVLEAAGVPFEDITLVHANDRLEALVSGTTQAAALMEPLVSRALAKGARKIADLRWRGGIVAGNDIDEETAGKLRRALNRAIAWLRENNERSREQVLRDLSPEQRRNGLMPELVGVQSYEAGEFQEKVDWMLDRGFLEQAPVYNEVVRSK